MCAQMPPIAQPPACAGQAAKQGIRRFTLAEVAQHSTPRDCWLIVRGKVYDVTGWAAQHPGGNMIFVKAGGECTQLFDSYHPLNARRVLEKFCIGSLAAGELVVAYTEDLEEGQFFAVLKKRVEKYFRGNQIDPRSSLAYYAKAVLILAAVAASYSGTFFAFQSFAASLACAVLLGVAMAEVGVSVMHDANHGAGGAGARGVLGATLDMVGASSFMWRQQHVVGHHAYTNLAGGDPDICSAADPDLRCITPAQAPQPHHRFQHVYMGLLYGVLAMKSVFLDDFASLAGGEIGPVSVAKMSAPEAALFWGGKAAFFCAFLGAPVLASAHSWAALGALWLVSEAAAGWLLALMFQVAHVTEGVKFVEADARGRVPHGWAEAQVLASADFAHGSWLWTHFSGGLNYQVVHHLFPNVCHTHYPAIAPIVLQTCAEFGIPYIVFPTFWAALSAHFQHLKTMGALGRVPSLATLG